MPPTDYNAMLYDHMSRSELLRRLSTHSSSTSSSSRKGSARVTKQSSAGNSPHNVQRRRTTPAQTARAYPRISQEGPFQTREQRLRHYYGARNSVPFVRPMSWQPGVETLQTSATSMPISEPAIGTAIEGLENLAVSGTPDGSVQQSIQDAFAMGYGLPVSRSNTMYQQSPTEMEGYKTVGTGLESTCNPYYSYNMPEQPLYEFVSQAPIYDSYTASTYQVPQWPQVEPEYSINSQTTQPNLDFLPLMSSEKTPQKVSVTTIPQLPKKGSKELVGMGLYDDEDKDFISTLNSAISFDSGRDSLGKGLKLEETWEPRKDDEDTGNEGAEEGYSSEEVEEVDEIPAVQSTTQPGIQTALYPTYGDLSNQSFFFSEDEQYATDDQYGNYMTFGQGLQDSQPKYQDPTTSSFVWF